MPFDAPTTFKARSHACRDMTSFIRPEPKAGVPDSQPVGRQSSSEEQPVQVNGDPRTHADASVEPSAELLW